ncbi:MAG: hypothetical protein IOMNBAOH_00134 [Rhodocyclaceae bacterium]|nr:hypothetical protein [Rhodocyclaceae bacterium]
MLDPGGMNMSIAPNLSAYAEWRQRVCRTLGNLNEWLADNNLDEDDTRNRIGRLIARLDDDRLSVAFVAEFSRGKSELVNAIFFAHYGQRILPSAAGRTTMCPTELLFDAAKPPCIELLPIETRAGSTTIQDLKRQSRDWVRIEIDPGSAASLHQGLRRVGEEKQVARAEAERLGFQLDPEGERGLRPAADGTVSIPAWRHALVNFPHPLLKQGLVILDTPGLNAVGAEPELTLSLLPSAHAVLFILAADTGVTQTDLATWHAHVVPAHPSDRGRLVVLNKIDGLWDGIKTDAEVQAEIDRQRHSCAEILELPATRIYPVSAQKGLAGKIRNDADLLARSCLPALEQALSDELIPAKREIITTLVDSEAQAAIDRILARLKTRQGAMTSQIEELHALRGKNQSVVTYMVRKVETEKDDFDQGLQRFHATRTVFSDLSGKLYAELGVSALKSEARRAHEAMQSAVFSGGLRAAMREFMAAARQRLTTAAAVTHEISDMMGSMYKRFAVEHGMKLDIPPPFSMAAYERELDKLQQAYESQFNTVLSMLLMEKRVITQKFIETVAARVKKVFESANRDVEYWLRNLMAPLESQIREYQIQLKRKLDSVRRINEASESLEGKLRELDDSRVTLDRQLAELGRIDSLLKHVLRASAANDPNPAPQAARQPS